MCPRAGVFATPVSVLGMRKPKEGPEADADALAGMSPEAWAREARTLTRKLAKVEELQEAMEKPAPV